MRLIIRKDSVYHAGEKTSLTFPAVTLLLSFLGVFSCGTPWYTLYGIESEQSLYTASSVPQLVKALDDENPSVRILALVALRKIGGNAKDAIQDLAKAVADPHQNVRMQAIVTVKTIALEEKEAVEGAVRIMSGALEDRNGKNRIYAVEVLHEIGLKEKEARELVVPVLERAMDDDHRNVSIRALRALSELDPGSEAAIPIFKSHFSSDDASTRRYAVLELKNNGYPREVFYDYLDHMANHDPRATVKRDALIHLKWYIDSPVKGERSSEPGPYRTIDESEKGYVQFDTRFLGGKFPLSVKVTKVIEGDSMPVNVKLGEPLAERPGSHLYSFSFPGAIMKDSLEVSPDTGMVKLVLATDALEATARVKEGMLSRIVLLVGERGKAGYFPITAAGSPPEAFAE